MLEYHQSFFLYSASLPMQAALRMYTPRATEMPAAPTSPAPKDTSQGKASPSQREQAPPEQEQMQQAQASADSADSSPDERVTTPEREHKP